MENNTKDKKENLINRLFKLYLKEFIITGLLILILSSLIFTNLIEYGLKIKPNLSAIDLASMEVHFVDVGQGDCTLVRFPNNKTMIIDSGTTSEHKRLIEYIDKVFFANSERIFDYALLTHSDSDHSGNMEYIINNYKISSFYRPRACAYGVDEEWANELVVSDEIYVNAIKSLYSSNIKEIHFTDEDDLYINDEKGNRLFTIYPHKNIEVDKTNEYSPIITIESYGRAVCITGDASKEIEKDVISNYILPDIDILKLGHHGSNTSTSLEFLEATTPEYAVVSVGVNSYGHPSEDTLSTLAEYDNLNNKSTYNNLMTTKDSGNIIAHISPSGRVEWITILNVFDYIFIPYFVFVVCISFVLITIILISIIKKTHK